LIVAFAPGGRFGVRGVDAAEMELDRERTPTRYDLFQPESP
jgi:hypothetical protein